MKLGTVYADAVTVPDGRRNLDPAAVDRLVESISAIGLQQPISVWAPDANTAILVAGRHRFEACKRLNWFEIPAVFVDMDERERRMWEISENLHRAELTTLERDEQVAEWIRLASEKPAQSAQVLGGRGKKGGVSQAAREIGVDRDDARRAEKVASLSEEAKEAAREHGLDDNRKAMLQAARETTPEDQVEALRTYKPVPPPPSERNAVEVSNHYRTALMNAWNKAPREDRDWFLEQIDKPVMDGRYAS
jgi:ParB family transcriptional regulator, chromosome partitioning protein